ncbi:FTR1 family iron permease [Bifidobacterium pullorum]|uniref:FTR1 family iron permease n=1 Tax=Bifidobacterium pullorum TaxID=78448 RepID=UPI003AF7176B
MTRTMTRIGAALLGLILTAAAALSLMIPAVADEPADPESWMQIAQTIVADLDAGVAEYVDGDHAGAASAFNVAYNTDYVASNFAKVVNDTIGADRYQNQRRQFQDLQRLVYQQNRRTDIETLRDALADDVRECGATLDGNGELSDPRDYARMREEQTAKEREALDAAKVHKNEGIGTRSWSDVATEMVSVLDDSLAASESGDGERGAELVNEAYYQYYEKLGFEKNVMNAIGGSRVSKVESTFKESRKAMVAGDAADAKAHVDELKTMLVEDAAALDGGAGSEVGGFTRLITSSFGQAFLILIREGLEALLVVAAIIAYLVKSGNRRLVRWIYLGVVAGLAASGAIAAVFMALFGGSGPQQEIMEGVCALVAMGMLLYTSNWMLNKSSVDAWNRYIRAKTEAAVARIGGTAGTDPTPERLGAAGIVSLALLSFLAVFREGAETVIFYQSIYSMTQDASGMWIGGITAAVVLIGVFLLIRFTSVRIPIRPFFIVTSVLLAVLVVIFAGGGVHSLIEGDALGGIYLDGFPTNDWLGLYPYVETLAAQGIALAAVLALFAIGAARQAKTRRRAERMA